MKKIFLILAAVMAIAIPKAAQAVEVDTEGVYVGGIGGLNFLQYSNGHHEKVHFKAGWLAGALVGYRWCNGIRLEGEATYRYNQIKSIERGHHDHDSGSGSSTLLSGETHHHKARVRGHIRTWSFMANGIYEIPVCWCIIPYVGAGIGYDATQLKACRSHGSENGFAWQVLAGGLYPIDDCMEMGLEYRFHKGKVKNLYNHAVDVKFDFFF